MRPLHTPVPEVMPGHDLGDRASYCVRFLKVHDFITKEEAERIQGLLNRCRAVETVLDAFGCPHEKTAPKKQIKNH